MAVAPYAAVADLENWLTRDPGPDAPRMLEQATRSLDDFLIGCTYNVDANGNPTDAATIQAFNDACCAQVEWWLANGDEFADTSRLTGYSIEGIAVQFKIPPPRIAPRSVEILRVAGIYPSITPIHLP